MRNIVANPYTPEEQRVADWLARNGGVGGGDDPIGFLLASYAFLIAQRNALRSAAKDDHSP